MKNINHNKFVLLIPLMLICLPATSRNFVHPGISHKLSDLDRMKYMVQASKEPWNTSFANLQANQYASYNYVVKWSLDSIQVVENMSSNYEKFKYDALAAYYNSLEWYITGDSRYAEKCIEIFKKMVNIRSCVSATASLGAGRVIWKLLEGAEIIKSTYSGWKQADIDAFKAMLVYPGYSTTVRHETDPEYSFYWAMYQGDYGRHGNQGLMGIRGIMAMGIFMDNDIMYDRALRYLRGQTHRSDDLSYHSGPTFVNSTKNASSSNSYYDDYSLYSPYTQNTVQDYGYNEVIKNYIWENGQCQESSRDQGHSILGVGMINNMCEMAWNQGDDLYSILNFRPLLGLEYFYRYNVSYNYTFADQPAAWLPTVASGEYIQRRDRSQRWLSKKINPYNAYDTVSVTRGAILSNTGYAGGSTPVTEMLLGHYKSRLNLPKANYKWTARADSIVQKLYGYEQQGFQVDHPGFGGLTFHRADSCAGDPVTFVAKSPVYRMNVVPCKIEAEDYDFFTANGQGHTFNELSRTKIANAYRPDSAVTVKPCSVGGYKVSDMAAGEWLSYTVEFPEYSQYGISINYSAAIAGGKLKINVNGTDKTTEIALPATGTDVWTDYVLPQTFKLSSGVQSLRIYVTGISNSFELNSIQISKVLGPGKNDYVSYQSGDFNTASNWRISDGAGGYLTTPTSAPTIANNVWIQTGHTMTAASSNVTCKNLVVIRTLIVGTSASSAKNITLGTSTAPGNLSILSTGVLASTTDNSSTIGSITVYGNTVNVDGRLGSATTTTTTGSGFRIICSNPTQTTLSGVGICNIVGLVPGAAISTDQELVIDMNLNLMNTSTTAQTLSLMNGDAGLGNKTLTINEGKTVTFTGGSVGLLHQMSGQAAQTVTGGNMTYNILGTLDTGTGGLYLTTSTISTSPSQNVNVNVGPNGALLVGSKFILIKSQSAQNINFNFASGSTIKYSGTVTPVFSTNGATGVTAVTFPASYSNLAIENPKGINLLSPASVEKSLTLTNGNLTLGANNLTLLSGSTIIGGSTASHIVTNSTGALIRSVNASVDNLFPVGTSANRYDPAVINPTSNAIFSVRVDSVFNVAPKYPALTNPIEWNISSSPSSVTADLSLSPSTATAVTMPVIAQVLNRNSWLETDATISGTTFIAQVTSFSAFGTGTVTGFGLMSALKDAIWNNVTWYTSGNNIVIKGLSAGNDIFIYNTTGQLLLHQKSSDNNASIPLPNKGLYLVEINSDNLKKTVKVIID